MRSRSLGGVDAPLVVVPAPQLAFIILGMAPAGAVATLAALVVKPSVMIYGFPPGSWPGACSPPQGFQ